MSKRAQSKNKSITYKGFKHTPHVVWSHSDYSTLSCRALKLLDDLHGQYNGKNNGDLCCAMSIMKHRGWNSNDQLTKSKAELIDKKLIIQTKQGGRNYGPSLYAITWQPINECEGKLDIQSTTRAPRKW
ncbi:MAG: hypothetical protein JKY88_06655 [Pseudomonadales bacterium]|nr:hypothetical protein [Pseudomonadales bacterium]